MVIIWDGPLKNDIMEDCFLFFCCSDQQFLSSALTQQFNSLTRLFFWEYFLTTFNALIISSILILLVSSSKTDGLSNIHRRRPRALEVSWDIFLVHIFLYLDNYVCILQYFYIFWSLYPFVKWMCWSAVVMLPF